MGKMSEIYARVISDCSELLKDGVDYNDDREMALVYDDAVVIVKMPEKISFASGPTVSVCRCAPNVVEGGLFDDEGA